VYQVNLGKGWLTLAANLDGHGKLAGSLAAESLAYYQATRAHLDYPICGKVSARASCFKTTGPFSELGIQHWDFPGCLHYAAVAARMSHGLKN